MNKMQEEKSGERDASKDTSLDASSREARRAYVADRMAAERNRRMSVVAANDALFDAQGEFSGEMVTLSSYAPMLMAALFKDLSDLAFIGSLPGIGTVVTFCASILIFFLALLRGSFRGRMKYKKGMVLIVGTAVEAFGFGINFLPMETLTVLAMYAVDKAEEKGGMIGKIAGEVKQHAIKKG